MSVAMLLEMATDAVPERVGVGTRESGLTYQEVLTRARRLATMLHERGDERLALVDLNSDAVPLCLFGAGFAGIPFAPVNYRLTDEHLRVILGRLAPALVIVGEGVEERVGDMDGIEVLRTDDLLAQLDDGDASDDLPFVDPEAIGVLLFTSGTTGEPKTAVLRHHHLTSYIFSSVEFLGADDDEAQLVSVPPYHIAGISAVLSSVYSGRRIVYLPVFEAERWVDLVAAEGITQAMVVPTMLGRILGHLSSTGQKLDRLRNLSYGGGRMPLELIRQAMELLPNVSFVNAYGLTETSSTIAVLGPGEHREAVASDDPRVRARLGSVGQPLPSIEVEIRDPDGQALPPGTRGEIYVRGEQVAGEYLGRRALTDDGWFPTNDAGYLDEDGYLFVDGRLDDVIVRGAENLSPGEIEDTLLAHPSVVEAAVVGVPDPEWGEAVAAAVVVDGEVTEDELRDWVRTRLRSTKTPDFIDFREMLPYNEIGKLLRRVLRDELSTSSRR
jgi:acyl-CoA synthetase (AMP-forming)/AMP-acid ligase II